MTHCLRRVLIGAISVASAAATLCGCSSWHGLNSLPMPFTEGIGAGSYRVHAQLADVTNIQPNSRVQIGDVAVGTVTAIKRKGWHALITMSLNGDVILPANSSVSVGQTSLLGSLHIELAPPRDQPPHGQLHDGSLIALPDTHTYPSTEQTLAAVSLLFNGGGLGQVNDITTTLATALRGREGDLRAFVEQLDTFIAGLNEQSQDIIRAGESLNNLAGRFAQQQPTLDRALDTIPEALAVLNEQRDHLIAALSKLNDLGALTTDTVNQTHDAIVAELQDAAPVLQALADAGPALTRSLSFLATYPWPKETIANWVRGDYANLSAVFDLTLSRIDASIFTGSRFEGDLTELEMQWGRTVGQKPSPYTAGNPLILPYHGDQGP